MNVYDTVNAIKNRGRFTMHIPYSFAHMCDIFGVFNVFYSFFLQIYGYLLRETGPNTKNKKYFFMISYDFGNILS